MKIRRFLLYVAILAVALCHAVSAAPMSEKPRRIGILMSRSRPASIEKDYLGAFFRSLRELGFTEGKNLTVEMRFSEGNHERLPSLAAELVAQEPDVLFTSGTPPALALQKTTRTVPIVFVSVADPVGAGLVKSLARPSGNATGTSLLLSDAASKPFEMLSSILPGLTRVAAIGNGGNPNSIKLLQDLGRAAQARGITYLPLEVQNRKDIADAFASTTMGRAQALICLSDSFLVQERELIAGLALKHRLPSIGWFNAYAEAGGLMSYGTDPTEAYERAASYVARILKGASPADLPVEQPMKLQLVINRRTAKALDLEIPAELLVLADRIIE